MTTRTKWSIGTLATVLAACAAGVGLARFPAQVGAEYVVKQAGAPTFVQRDTFALHMLKDSIIHAYEQSDAATMKATLDTVLTCQRHPKRKECQ